MQRTRVTQNKAEKKNKKTFSIFQEINVTKNSFISYFVETKGRLKKVANATAN